VTATWEKHIPNDCEFGAVDLLVAKAGAMQWPFFLPSPPLHPGQSSQPLAQWMPSHNQWQQDICNNYLDRMEVAVASSSHVPNNHTPGVANFFLHRTNLILDGLEMVEPGKLEF
jgi:hypothetical protein